MKGKLNCPLCREEIYSKAGIGCVMCGMPLENKDEEFCSEVCEKIFDEVNNL